MQHRALAVVIAAALALGGCDKDMASQNKDKTWHAAHKPPNGLTWPLTPPDGMVARDPPAPPPALSLALLQRGRERYDIACAPCHARTGEGNGVIVQRGFPAPPPLSDQRIVAEPTRHYVDVIADGYGIMYAFPERVAPRDRWAVAAYIRALQRARAGTIADVPADRQATLK
ncbi:MAG TPA: cytochrome c [Stellaceae bacterium]|jgi:mono/diheme cytochrome c family protein|nr:cytochrome c [Stellaceae bacterium]